MTKSYIPERSGRFDNSVESSVFLLSRYVLAGFDQNDF